MKVDARRLHRSHTALTLHRPPKPDTFLQADPHNLYASVRHRHCHSHPPGWKNTFHHFCNHTDPIALAKLHETPLACISQTPEISLSRAALVALTYAADGSTTDGAMRVICALRCCLFLISNRLYLWHCLQTISLYIGMYHGRET